MRTYLSITKLLNILLTFVVLMTFVIGIYAEELESTNYKLLDTNINSGGGTSDSTNYSLLSSTGDPTSDSRATSASYSLNSGFPEGIQANVPLVDCFETSTDSSTTNCNDFPNANGAIGECGDPGCYDSAKIEIDPQNNPVDALYLVSVTDTSTNTEYFLQSNNTIDVAANTTIADYHTTCSLMGIDTRSGSGCETSSDPNWDESLQSVNIFGLLPNRTYEVKARALNGDYTETNWSPSSSTSTVIPSMSFDIDIDTTSTVETAPPHSIDLGTLTTVAVSSPSEKIWFDIGTNITAGGNVYVRSATNGLEYNGNIIPSEAEDLAADDGDGGFGFKVDNTDLTQTSLGPIQANNSFVTTGADEVDLISTTDKLLFFTDNTGTNSGQVNGASAGVNVKALAGVNSAGGSYDNELTFTFVSNL